MFPPQGHTVPSFSTSSRPLTITGFLDEDGALENDLRATVAATRQRTWDLYANA